MSEQLPIKFQEHAQVSIWEREWPRLFYQNFVKQYIWGKENKMWSLHIYTYIYTFI